jgi:hypothetical protein
MFCIAAFIVLLVMGAVSAKYRRIARIAFGCAMRRVTFRPCDTTFKQDLKDHLLAPIAVRTPQLVRPASIGLEVVAWLVILTTVWSGYTVVKSGLNLYVYGTCNKENSESCTLGAEACAIPDQTPTFWGSIAEFDVLGAFGNEFASLGETISSIPTRMQKWEASDYLPANETYLNTFDEAMPTALEVIDPGCQFCRQLFANITEAGFDGEYNLTYVPYPIEGKDGYKFPNSLLVTQYLEALRLSPLNDGPANGGAADGGAADDSAVHDGATTGSAGPSSAAGDVPATVDWQVLERIFTGETDNGVPFQSRINGLNRDDATALLDGWLSEFGLTADDIATIKASAASAEVADVIAENKQLVEDEIHTVKVPTIIFDGRRHDGLVSVDGLE